MTWSMSAAIAVAFLLVFSLDSMARELTPMPQCGQHLCLDAIESRDGAWIVRVLDGRRVIRGFETHMPMPVEVEIPALGISRHSKDDVGLSIPGAPPGGTGWVAVADRAVGYQHDEYGVHILVLAAAYVDDQLVDVHVIDDFITLAWLGDDEEN